MSGKPCPRCCRSTPAWRLPGNPASPSMISTSWRCLCVQDRDVAFHDAQPALSLHPIGHDLRRFVQKHCAIMVSTRRADGRLARVCCRNLPATPAHIFLLDRIRATHAKGSRKSRRRAQRIRFSAPKNRAPPQAHFDQARGPGNPGGGEVGDNVGPMVSTSRRTDVCDLLRKHGCKLRGVEVRGPDGPLTIATCPQRTQADPALCFYQRNNPANSPPTDRWLTFFG